MSSASKVAAVLLAAGRSRRVGAFKPLLQFGDQTVVESCIGNLREGGIETIIVVLGHRAGEVRERLAHLPVRFAINPDPDSEMGLSIARGIEQVPVEAQAVFIALTDQPAIPPGVICFLLDEWRRTGAGLVVPEYMGRGGHPVLLDLRYREELLHLDPQRGLRGLFDAHPESVLRVPVASPYVVRDVDTWDDYLDLYREIFGTSPPHGQPSQGSGD
ncbi:MAG TPA: nucleotidyltransferase family protein [Pyrinomonadaceae bacterium]|nr:nucleotidyltransferase family protein [Pyrinomonadaceae bacterium]